MLLVVAAAAWVTQGWRYGAELADQRANRVSEVAEGQRQAREIHQRRYAEVGEVNERNERAEWGAYGEGCAMRKFRTMACGLMLMPGVSGCASKQVAPPPAVECPTPESPPA